jgi:hypothetical protein
MPQDSSNRKAPAGSTESGQSRRIARLYKAAPAPDNHARYCGPDSDPITDIPTLTGRQVPPSR